MRLPRLVIGLKVSFSTNEKKDQKQSQLVCAIFPALWTSYMQVIARNSDWSELLVGYWFFNSHLKTVLRRVNHLTECRREASYAYCKDVINSVTP